MTISPLPIPRGPSPKTPTSLDAHFIKTFSCLPIALRREAWLSRPTTSQFLLALQFFLPSFLFMGALHWPPSIRNAYHPDLPDLFHFLLPVTHTYMHMCTYTCTHTYQLPPPQYHPAPCTHSPSQLESHCIIFVCACSASPETEVLRAEATSDFLLHP